MNRRLHFCFLILFMLFSFGLSAPLWSNWKYDRQLTGRCPFLGPEQPEIDWVFDTGDTFKIRVASVVIGGDTTIYFTSPDSFLFAIRPDGSLKWQYKTKGIPYFPGIDEYDRIYCSVMGDSIWLLALDDSLTYAKLVWSWSQVTPESYWLSPVNIGVDRTIYMSTDSMRAIDSTGNLKWTYHRGLYCAYPPAISHDGSTLYYEWCIDQWTNAIASRDTSGNLNWYRVVGPAPMSLAWGSPAIGRDSAIYFSTGDGRLYGLYPNNYEKWPPQNDLGDLIFMNVSLGLGDTIWLINRMKRPIYRKFSPDDGSIVFIDSITATPSQSSSYNAFIFDSLGQAYIVLRDSGTTYSTLYAFNPDGTIKWSFTLPGPMTTKNSIAIGPNNKIYLCAGTKLFAIKDVAGAEEFSVNNNPFVLEISPNPFRDYLEIGLRNAKNNFQFSSFDPLPSIKIYDVCGRIVKQFFASSVRWWGDDNLGQRLPAGVYFVRLDVGDYTKTEKVILLR